MTNYTRPDRASLRAVIASAERADGQYQYVMNVAGDCRKQILHNYQAEKKEAANELLRQIDVEDLNRQKQGIRVSLLRSAHLENIYQVLCAGPRRLININGIGEAGADKIMRIARMYQQEAQKKARIRLDDVERNPRQAAILQGLYLLLELQQDFKLAGSVQEKCHLSVQDKLQGTRQLQSSLGWIFKSARQKQQALDAYVQLRTLTGQGYVNMAAKLQGHTWQTLAQDTGALSRQAFARNTAPFYAALEEVTGERLEEKAYSGGLSEEYVQSIETLDLDLSLMRSTLRQYQLFGVKYILQNRRVLLGDEMGLGKTIQAIACMAHLKAQGKTHFLVVCPVSVMVNWSREVSNHSTQQALEIHGLDRGEEYDQWGQEGGVGITTYETITRLELGEEQIDLLVVDEAHYVKNPKAQRTQALQRLAQIAEYVLFMTGTPLENRVEEMIFLVSMLNGEVARNLERVAAISTADSFREAASEVYLRRIREDVLTELPEKEEKQEWCAMNRQEREAYYHSLLEGNYMAVRQVSWNVEDIKDSSKAARLLELCETARENGRRVIIFSFFLHTIQTVMQLLGDRCYGPISGGVSGAKRQEILDAFGESAPGSVLVSQIIAGGTGINVQAASVVILCEPQWKPSTEEQAISRAYRMGQQQKVMVHRLLSQNSIDERMLEILQGKADIFERFAQESVAGERMKEMSEETAMKLIIRAELERLQAQENLGEAATE
ncbi:MAG: DEAD/DEAH box helicase [bacterium]|nr:DEAD/DEAH box helicase [bacterium]MCM1373517.1 DEAD/DEAH box helicase [Muribaculum sp.]